MLRRGRGGTSLLLLLGMLYCDARFISCRVDARTKTTKLVRRDLAIAARRPRRSRARANFAISVPRRRLASRRRARARTLGAYYLR